VKLPDTPLCAKCLSIISTEGINVRTPSGNYTWWTESLALIIEAVSEPSKQMVFIQSESGNLGIFAVTRVTGTDLCAFHVSAALDRLRIR